MYKFEPPESVGRGVAAAIFVRGSELLLKRKGTNVSIKEGTRVMSLKQGGFGVYSMNKTKDRRKCLYLGPVREVE